jgi:glutathione S-transferase
VTLAVPMTLVIGDRQLSSWSLRPWLALRHLGLPCSELVLPLDTPRFHAEIDRWSPSGRVPVLLHGAVRVWDSLAICEYANELAHGAGWPADPAARALARSVSAEMHAGFAALRTLWPMQAASRGLVVPLDSAARADVARIEAIWSECRARYGSDGPWLFGANYSIADAMYAPVVLRFASYGATLSPTGTDYVLQVLADTHLREWIRGAGEELTARPAP